MLKRGVIQHILHAHGITDKVKAQLIADDLIQGLYEYRTPRDLDRDLALEVPRAVAKWYGIRTGLLFGSNGNFIVREARNLCYFILVELYNYTVFDTSLFMEKKGSGAISHGKKKIEGLLEAKDERVTSMLEEVRRELYL